MKIFLSTLKFNNDCKIFKKIYFSQLDTQEKKYLEIGSKTFKIACRGKNDNFIRDFLKDNKSLAITKL